MSGTTEKPRYRVQAGTGKAFTSDSFVNFAANLGYGTQNLASASTYQLTPISRNHYQLEMMYRGSWLVRQIIDSVAEDMTRAGAQFTSDMPPDDEAAFVEEVAVLLTWQKLQETLKWARLYGGCLAVMMIDGQDPAEPLRVDRIGPGAYKGLLVLDRWMLTPDLSNTVRAMGPDFGLPMFYNVVSDAHSVPGMRVHHSRCLRFEGADLPYWQKMAENMWGLSVIEPMFDRMIAFDSATNGAAQLVHKAHLRTLSVENLRELIASGGASYQAFLEQVSLIRLMQSNEGMTILDAADKFEVQQYSFAGLSDVLVQFGQQLSGAAQIPLVRLFGQSPAGMNATGESDIRNYYDMINAQQEAKLRRPLRGLFEVICYSKFGRPLPRGFNFSFRPLWQLQETEKAQTANTITQTILQAHEASLISDQIALKELREQSHLTGIWSNISDEDIEAADDQIPDPSEMGGPGMMPPGAEGSESPDASVLPGQPTGNMPPNSYQQPQQQAGADDSRRPALSRPGEHPLDRFIRRRRQGRNRRQRVLSILHGDQRSLVEIDGLRCIIETGKGERRQGPGWQHVMPCDYGYISGTSSAEGPREQMDCFIGEHPNSGKVFLIYQHNPHTGEFDEHKVMLAFPDKQSAINAYLGSFGDGLGGERMRRIDEMSISHLKRWLRAWKFGAFNPKQLNGHALADRRNNGSL